MTSLRTLIVVLCAAMQLRARLDCQNIDKPEIILNSEKFNFLMGIGTAKQKISTPQWGVEVYLLTEQTNMVEQSIKFNLRNPIVKQIFNSKRKLISQLQLNDALISRPSCVHNKDYAYISFSKIHDSYIFAEVMHRMAVSDVKKYLVNLARLFKNYEILGVAFVDADEFTFSVMEADIHKPYASSLENIHKISSSFYLHQDSKEILDRLSEENRVDQGPAKNTRYVLVKVTKSMNTNTLFKILSRTAHSYLDFLTTNPIKRRGLSALDKFAENMDLYQKKPPALKSTLERFDEIVAIIDKLLP